MKNGKLTVAIVGMGFGSCFLPIYLKHPDVEHVIMVDTNPDQLKALADMYLLDESYYTTDFEAVLQNPDVDAVRSGHSARAACAHVGSGAQRRQALRLHHPHGYVHEGAGRRYQGAEGFRQTLYVHGNFRLHPRVSVCEGAVRIRRNGQAAVYALRPLSGYGGLALYWDGFPPLAHPTHAIGPCFALAGQRPVSVFGRGSGKVRPELEKQYGCPFAFESALVALEDGETTVEMERFLYHVARGYSECFNIYGENKSFEWDQLNGDKHVMFSRDLVWENENRGGKIDEEYVQVPDYAHLLPDVIGRFTYEVAYDEVNPHLSFKQGGGHGGSHPHLVHEFVTSILEDRTPFPSDIDAALLDRRWSPAHESAMEGGTVKSLPKYEEL